MTSGASLKICLVGPCAAGKTLTARILGQQNFDWREQHDHAPTRGLRIQEASVFVEMEKIDLELWDCPGDVSYRKYWPVFAEGSDGVLIVFDPEAPDVRLLEKLFKAFVLRTHLPQSCVALTAVRKRSTDTPRDGRLLCSFQVMSCSGVDGIAQSEKLKNLTRIELDVMTRDADLNFKILTQKLRPFLKNCSSATTRRK